MTLFCYQLGWFAHPIFHRDGNYPPIMIDTINNRSKAESRLWSRLPTLSRPRQRGDPIASDFFGLNYYTSRIVSLANRDDSVPPSMQKDAQFNVTVDPLWHRAKSTWLYSVPVGLGDLLRFKLMTHLFQICI